MKMINQIIGQRIRIARTEAKMSLKDMEAHFDITRMQFSNYETGRSQISAARLWEIAVLLHKPVSWFYL